MRLLRPHSVLYRPGLLHDPLRFAGAWPPGVHRSSQDPRIGDKKIPDHAPGSPACRAPVQSPEGTAYFGAMAAAANYAWANRQLIMHAARREFVRMFGIDYESMPLVYDVTHNVAKIEEHMVPGQKVRLCVHRKGATRSFGPETPGLPGDLAAIGQPVIIPGSMGTSSFVLKGTATAMERTFGSTCHGSGRVMSRSQAKKKDDG